MALVARLLLCTERFNPVGWNFRLLIFGMFVLLLSSSSLPRVIFATDFRISADPGRSALPHSVSSGARVFVVLISVRGIRFPLRGTHRRAFR